jgi:hypothetical protein
MDERGLSSTDRAGKQAATRTTHSIYSPAFSVAAGTLDMRRATDAGRIWSFELDCRCAISTLVGCLS